MVAAATQLCCAAIFLKLLTEDADTGFMLMVPQCCFRVNGHPADRAELCGKHTGSGLLQAFAIRQVDSKLTASGVPRSTVTVATQTVCFVKDLLATG